MPSSRPALPMNRTASHPIKPPIPPPPSHYTRHSISALSPPLIDFEKADDVTPSPVSTLPPPLPSRHKPPVLISSSSHSQNGSLHGRTGSPSSASSGDSDSSSTSSTFVHHPPSLPQRPPSIQPPPPPRRSPAHSNSFPLPDLSTPTNSDYTSETSTLRPPPRLPVRRSPPPRASSLHPDLHEGLTSAPPALELKSVGNISLPPPPQRSIALGDRPPPLRKGPDDASLCSSDEEESLLKGSKSMELLPDASNSSRRPPLLRSTAFERAAPHVHAHSGLIVVAGDYCVVANHDVKIYNFSISQTAISTVEFRDGNTDVRIKDPRVTSMEFRPADNESERGRFLWLATRDGHLWELDVFKGSVVANRTSVHATPVTHILRHQQKMITIDGSGKVLIFFPESLGCSGMLTQCTPKVVRITEKQGFAKIMFGLLWTSGGTGTSGGSGSSSGSVSTRAGSFSKGPSIRLYDIFATTLTHNALNPSVQVGAVTSGALLQTHPHCVYLGHEGGFVTIWDMATADSINPVFVEAVKISPSDILCMDGVHSRLWVGGRNGVISVFDVEQTPWIITNSWKAHSDLPVHKLFVDPWSIEKCNSLNVISVGRDEQARFWDGLLAINHLGEYIHLFMHEVALKS